MTTEKSQPADPVVKQLSGNPGVFDIGVLESLQKEAQANFINTNDPYIEGLADAYGIVLANMERQHVQTADHSEDSLDRVEPSDQSDYWAGFEEGQRVAQHNASVREDEP